QSRNCQITPQLLHVSPPHLRHQTSLQYPATTTYLTTHQGTQPPRFSLHPLKIRLQQLQNSATTNISILTQPP
ncbi:34336_t:CDS:1, partial [Gigaspora margarita]